MSFAKAVGITRFARFVLVQNNQLKLQATGPIDKGANNNLITGSLFLEWTRM